MGHPEYHFVQAVMELQKSVTRVETILDEVQRTTEITRGKVSKVEKVIYAAGVVLVIAIAVGGWALNTLKDFVMTYYKASVEAQFKHAAPPVLQPPTKSKQ